MTAFEDVSVPDDAGEHADALAAILRRIPRAWGREVRCHSGWYGVLADLDAELSALLPSYGLHQVQEKVGSLHYYVAWGDVPRDVSPAMREVVRLAAARSAVTCERCGGSGVLRRRRSWVQTLCDDCGQTYGFWPVAVDGEGRALVARLNERFAPGYSARERTGRRSGSLGNAQGPETPAQSRFSRASHAWWAILGSNQ